MKHLIITPLCWLLGIMLGTFLAPIAINIIVWLLQPDYIKPYRCTYPNGAQDSSPTERERRKGQA